MNSHTKTPFVCAIHVSPTHYLIADQWVGGGEGGGGSREKENDKSTGLDRILKTVWSLLQDEILHSPYNISPLQQSYYTVKRVDEVVRYPHLVTQDQFTQVSKKVSDIPEENFTINIELFQDFSQVSN